MIQFHYVPSGGEHLATSLNLPSSRSGPRPTAVVVHGLTGQRTGRSYHLVDLARRLADTGIACIRFDQRGCGESTGDFADLTIPGMAEDTLAIARWAQAQPWCDPGRFAYVGLSLGGLAAIAAEAETGSRAVALWAPVYDMPRVFRATSRTGLRALLEHQGWVPYRGLRIGKCFIDTLGACDPGTRLGQSAAPIRIYHSETDDLVPILEAQSYAARCDELGRPCSVVRFEAADHDFLDYADRQRLLGDTTAFLQEHLA